MKYVNTNLKTDAFSLKQCFEKNIPTSVDDCKPGEIYGCVIGNQFELHKRRKPMSIRILADDYIFGTVDEDGSVQYAYKRTWSSRIMTIIYPIFALVIGVVLGGMILKIEEMFLWLFVSVPFLFCNFIKPKKLHSDLLDALVRMINSSKST